MKIPPLILTTVLLLATQHVKAVEVGTIPSVRILCLGDSITEGNKNMVVYKGPLYDKLAAAGYRFQFVGSRSSSYTSSSSGDIILKHEGYG